MCVKNCLPVYLEKHKDQLPQNPKMEDFDELVTVDKSISDVQDLCCCILPKSSDIKTGPNNCRYIHVIMHPNITLLLMILRLPHHWVQLQSNTLNPNKAGLFEGSFSWGGGPATI